MSDETSTPPIPGSMRPWACHDGHIFSVRDGEHIGNVEGYFDAHLIVTAVNQHDALLARILCLESDLALERGRVEGLTEGVERLKADVVAADERMGVLDGTFAVGDGTAQREIERLTTQVASLKVALDDALDGWQGLWESDNNDPPPLVIAAIRTVHLSPPTSAQGEEGT